MVRGSTRYEGEAEGGGPRTGDQRVLKGKQREEGHGEGIDVCWRGGRRRRAMDRGSTRVGGEAEGGGPWTGDQRVLKGRQREEGHGQGIDACWRGGRERREWEGGAKRRSGTSYSLIIQMHFIIANHIKRGFTDGSYGNAADYTEGA